MEKVFSLTPTPPANAFVPLEKTGSAQEKFPLDLHFCNDCKHLQLVNVVSPDVLFRDYVYVSGTSPVFVKHFENYATSVINDYDLKHEDLVIDIGSNDGTLLSFFQKAGMRVLGIDPAVEIAKEATKRGIDTIAGFIDKDLAKSIASKHGKAKIITANNVFAHIDDLDSVIESVKIMLSNDGFFVFEVSYLVDVYEKTLFDTIYHEHLSYHSVTALKSFFAKHGMSLADVKRIDTHGGSIRGYARINGTSSRNVSSLIDYESRIGLDKAETFVKYADKIDALGKQLKTKLEEIKKSGKTIAAYGAPAKATTLMYHFGITGDLIDFVVDDSPLKAGLYTPGLYIPVVGSDEIYKKMPDYMLILAWNFADSIIKNHEKYRANGGKFIIPLPKLEVF